jgi:hypothetical protein
MRSLAVVLADACPGQKSLSALAKKYGQNSLGFATAEYLIRDFHKRMGGNFGQLGTIGFETRYHPETGYQRNTQLGLVTLSDVSSLPTGITNWVSNVTLAGIHCFSAQDIETDELFAVISLITYNPTAGPNQLVSTMRLPVTDVKSRQTIFENVNIGDVQVSGSGIIIHVSLWDHESGDVEEIKQKVAAVIEEATKKAQKAIAAGALGDDPAVTAGQVGDVTEWEIAGVKPFHILSVGLAGVIAEGLADDMLGDVSFYVPSSNLIEFDSESDFYKNSLRTNEFLPFDSKANWPPKDSENKPFNAKDPALYYAWFKITTVSRTVPLDPPLR